MGREIVSRLVIQEKERPAQVPDGLLADGGPRLDALLLLPRVLVDSGPDPPIQEKDLAPEQTALLKRRSGGQSLKFCYDFEKL
jgi:hypothetical protein